MIKMAESLLILVTKPPYGYEEAFAGLRAGLGMLASGQVPVSNALLVGEGTLNAVIDRTKKTGTKIHAERFAGRNNRFSRANSFCFLIYLYRVAVAPDFDNLSEEPQFSDPGHLVHLRACKTPGDNQGTAHLYNRSL